MSAVARRAASAAACAALAGAALAQPIPEFVDQVFTRPPRMLVIDPGCRPAYPPAALKAQVQGESHVRFVFDAVGRVLSSEIVRDAPPTPEQRLLDEAAVSALAGCPFSPGIDANNRPAGGVIDVRYRWVIEPPSPAHAARILPPILCGGAYPLDALQARAEGTTRLAFHLDETGKVLGVEVVQPSGDTPAHHALDRAAAWGLSTCSFEPARDASGQGVPGVATSSYTWRLPQPARAEDK